MNYNKTRLEQYSNNLMVAYNDASPSDVKNGMVWYSSAKSDIIQESNRIGCSTQLFAAVTAVISPGLRWEQNIEYASQIITKKNYDGLSVAYGYHNYHKALSMVDGGHISDYLNGQKVSAFYHTLLDDNYSVPVIDTWMIRMLRGRNTQSFTSNMLLHAVRVFQEVSEGMDIKVCQLQAITWEYIRQSWLSGQWLKSFESKLIFEEN